MGIFTKKSPEVEDTPVRLLSSRCGHTRVGGTDDDPLIRAWDQQVGDVVLVSKADAGRMIASGGAVAVQPAVAELFKDGLLVWDCKKGEFVPTPRGTVKLTDPDIGPDLRAKFDAAFA